MKDIIPMLMIAIVALSACSQQGAEQEMTTSDTERINTAAAGDEVPSQGAEVAFKKQYSEAEDISWSIDANDFHEANFTLNGEKYRADYTAQGKWVETENSLKFDKLPKAVREVVEKEFDTGDISEIERVDNAERGVFYDVEFSQKGQNRDVEIREDGEIIKQ